MSSPPQRQQPASGPAPSSGGARGPVKGQVRRGHGEQAFGGGRVAGGEKRKRKVAREGRGGRGREEGRRGQAPNVVPPLPSVGSSCRRNFHVGRCDRRRITPSAPASVGHRRGACSALCPAPLRSRSTKEIIRRCRRSRDRGVEDVDNRDRGGRGGDHHQATVGGRSHATGWTQRAGLGRYDRRRGGLRRVRA